MLKTACYSDLTIVLEVALVLIFHLLAGNFLLVITYFFIRGLWGPLGVGERLLKTSTFTEAVQKANACYNESLLPL